MRMLAMFPGAAAILFTVLAGSCESEPAREVPLTRIEAEVVDVVCDQMFACDCPNATFYESRDQCAQTAQLLADEMRAWGESEHDLTWDPTCLGKILDRIDDAGCGPTLVSIEIDECAPTCAYFHGNEMVGGTCELGGTFVSDCAQGLTCRSGVCVEPCGDDPGDPRGDEGESCDNGCKERLYCDFNVNVCRMLPGIGEACDFGQCAAGGFCENEDPSDPMTPLVCKAPSALAEPCRGHAQCESGYCPAGFCAELPGEGESCRGTFACAEGLDCVEETCVAGAPAVCQLPIPLPGF